MASFARGFRLLSCPRAPLTPRTILPDLSSAQSRFFTAHQVEITDKPNECSPAPPSASVAPSRYAFVKSLASKQTPTLLYEAPSHFWFYFGCWSSGISIIAWTVLTGPTAIQQPEGIPQWVGFTFGASYALLGAMGFYLISKTPNIVSSIRVLPLFKQPAKRPPDQESLPATDLDKVALKTRFSLPSEYVPELRRLELQLEEEARKKALWKFDMEHLFTMPFRRISRAFVNMFKGVRAAWTDVGYGIIKVDGKQYKVDVTKGYAHDGFRTLERVVTSTCLDSELLQYILRIKESTSLSDPLRGQTPISLWPLNTRNTFIGPPTTKTWVCPGLSKAGLNPWNVSRFGSPGLPTLVKVAKDLEALAMSSISEDEGLSVKPSVL
ncbi:hypothetical protein TrVFT333_005528 [Trichoderma virens FT-333]|nr:hypothetical protein TrVFT333_005528 [Trichoderma virens FT-333]